MNVKVISENFELLLSEPASKDNVYKMRDAINYTSSSGLSNLNKLLEAIKNSGNTELHKQLCSKLYTIGTAIDIIFSNNIDLASYDYSLYSSVGEFLIDLESFCKMTSYQQLKSDIEQGGKTLCIDNKVYTDYLSLSLSGKITRVKVNVK